MGDETNPHAAHLATEIAYSTLHRHLKGISELSVDSAKKLQDWSIPIGAARGLYIDAALALGVVDPFEHRQTEAASAARAASQSPDPRAA